MEIRSRPLDLFDEWSEKRKSIRTYLFLGTIGWPDIIAIILTKAAPMNVFAAGSVRWSTTSFYLLHFFRCLFENFGSRGINLLRYNEGEEILWKKYLTATWARTHCLTTKLFCIEATPSLLALLACTVGALLVARTLGDIAVSVIATISVTNN